MAADRETGAVKAHGFGEFVVVFVDPTTRRMVVEYYDHAWFLVGACFADELTSPSPHLSGCG